jgi:hypothetical protein
MGSHLLTAPHHQPTSRSTHRPTDTDILFIRGVCVCACVSPMLHGPALAGGHPTNRTQPAHRPANQPTTHRPTNLTTHGPADTNSSFMCRCGRVRVSPPLLHGLALVVDRDPLRDRVPEPDLGRRREEEGRRRGGGRMRKGGGRDEEGMRKG